MGQVFNLDALETESKGTPFRFTFGGEDYELPVVGDLRVGAALLEGRPDQALTMLLGPEQWGRMKASPAVMDDVKFAGLLDAYFAHVGASRGESSASSS